MIRRRAREIEVFSLSFLDVISCGFGAVILLLVITLAFEPSTVRELAAGLAEQIAGSEMSRERIIAEHQALQRELAQKRRDLDELGARVAALTGEWQRARRELGVAQAGAEQGARITAELEAVQQRLSEEMRRLLAQPDYRPPDTDAPIGGIPVDSEYILFVVDTSGSMQQGAWPLVVRKMREVLDSYPRVRGLQVLSDQGTYMFPSYAGQWIPDTPARRAVLIERLRNWTTFSASNPAPGIVQAIQAFHKPGQPMSIFVFGDDFNGPSIEAVVDTVARLNGRSEAGQTLVRIHTFGFPVLPIMLPRLEHNFPRFAHLMRVLAEQNSGSFVGLNGLR